MIRFLAWIILGFRARSKADGRQFRTAAWATGAWRPADDGLEWCLIGGAGDDSEVRQAFASQPAHPLCCARGAGTAAHRRVRTNLYTAEWIGNQLALLFSEYRVRAMRGSLMYAPIFGYWILAVVVSLDLRAQWTLAVFGPPLVLMAWLDAQCRSHAIVEGNLTRRPASSAMAEMLRVVGNRHRKGVRAPVPTAAEGAAPHE